MSKASTKFPGLRVTRNVWPDGRIYYFNHGQAQHVYEVSARGACLVNPGRIKMGAAVAAHCKAYAQQVSNHMATPAK